MKVRIIYLLFVSTPFAITFLSCNKEAAVVNEEELITSITYTLTPIGQGETVVFKFVDIDGDGGNPPIKTSTGNLKVNSTYSGSIVLLNESLTPSIEITTEIQKEKEDHQFFYTLSSSLLDKVVISYSDIDANKNPVGLLTSVKANSPETGKLKITLRHQPNKNGKDVSLGNIANAGGETDMEVEFDITVQ